MLAEFHSPISFAMPRDLVGASILNEEAELREDADTPPRCQVEAGTVKLERLVHEQPLQQYAEKLGHAPRHCFQL